MHISCDAAQSWVSTLIDDSPCKQIILVLIIGISWRILLAKIFCHYPKTKELLIMHLLTDGISITLFEHIHVTMKVCGCCPVLKEFY